jgi:hypothetical protein
LTTLQAAVDSGAKSLYVPQGQFNFSGTIAVASAMKFFGEGLLSSIFAGTSTTQDMFNVTTTAPVYFGDLSISSTVTKTAGIGIKFDPAGATQNDYSMIERVYFGGQFQSIDFVKAAYWSVHSCHFGNNASDGIVLKIRNTTTPDSGDQSIFNNSFYGGTGVTHIRYEGGGGLKVIGNKILQGSYGFLTGFGADVYTGILIIKGNSFDGQVASSVELHNAEAGANFTDMVIDGNQFNGSPSTAFIVAAQLAGSSLGRCSITSNQFIQHTGVVPHILLESGGQYSVFSNCLCGNGGTVAISVGSGVTYSTIGPNMLFGVIISNSSATTNVWASA